MWGIPSLVKIAVYGQDRYPFVYYSSLLKEFCFTEFDGRKNALHDVSGRVYTREQFDSVMPLLNFRQLHSNGTMPDSVEGIALDPRILRTKQVVFRYSPKDIHTPDRGLYIMYESLSGRVNLESPGDVFRLKDKIEFIDIKSNAVNEKKSALFQAALEKEGYAFPAQWTSGNLNIRKPYDEGYFSLDMNGNLFHIKMVNSRPYVRDTKIGKQMKIVWFSLLEVADKRFYGFLFDKEGKVYIVEEGGGKYSPLKLSIDPLDLDKDNLSIMGNLLYWTVSIENTLGKRIYALKTNDLTRVDSYFVPAPDNKWNAYSKLLFPVYLTFKSPDSDYIAPYIHITGFYGFVFNVICSVAAVLLGNSVKRRMFNFIYVLFTGIAGVIALLLIPAFKEQK
jgi:hypothetical protein